MRGYNMSDTCWLPPLEYFNRNQQWSEYSDTIYEIFKSDFIDSYPIFKGKRVIIRKEPIEFGKEEAFFHITCQDYAKNRNRQPDLRRCERIRWVRAFIENYNCDPTLCESCEGVKIWEEPYQNRKRVHILLEEERYIVILEPRNKYCFLITAFYFDHDHYLRKQLQHFEEFREK